MTDLVVVSPQRRGRGRPPLPPHLRANAPRSPEGNFMATVLPKALRRNNIESIHLVVYNDQIHFIWKQYRLLIGAKDGCRTFKSLVMPRISLRRSSHSKSDQLLGAVQNILPVSFLIGELATKKPAIPHNGKVIDWSSRDVYLLEFYRFLSTCTIEPNGSDIIPHYDIYALASLTPPTKPNDITITCAKELLLMHRVPHYNEEEEEEVSSGMVPSLATTPPPSPSLPPLLPPNGVLRTTEEWKEFSLTMLDHVGTLHTMLKRTLEFNDVSPPASPPSSSLNNKRQRIDTSAVASSYLVV